LTAALPGATASQTVLHFGTGCENLKDLYLVDGPLPDAGA